MDSVSIGRILYLGITKIQFKNMEIRLHIPKIEDYDKAVVHFYSDSPYGYEYMDRQKREISFTAFSESHAEQLKKCISSEIAPLGITHTFN